MATALLCAMVWRMTVLVAIGLLLLAAVLLAGGAELFAEHAAAAGRRLGVTAVAVGLLLAGAEPEELVTALLAAARGQDGIAVGDAIGANVTLLTLVLGVTAVVSVVPLSGRVRDYAVGAVAAGAAAVGALADGRVTRIEGVGLIALYIAMVAYVWWREREAPAIGEVAEALEDDGPDEPAIRGLALALGGIALMGAGGWAAVTGAERAVAALHVDGTAIGLTLVALATTAEFVALVFAAWRRGVPELAVAGIVGSVAYNATVTLGAAALLGGLTVPGALPAAIAAVALSVTVVAGAVVLGRLNRGVGLALVGAYAAYVWFVWH